MRDFTSAPRPEKARSNRGIVTGRYGEDSNKRCTAEKQGCARRQRRWYMEWFVTDQVMQQEARNGTGFYQQTEAGWIKVSGEERRAIVHEGAGARVR